MIEVMLKIRLEEHYGGIKAMTRQGMQVAGDEDHDT